MSAHAEGDRLVVGPPHCEHHPRGHVIGCLGCAAAVCESDDLSLDAFFDALVDIGWVDPRFPEDDAAAAGASTQDGEA